MNNIFVYCELEENTIAEVSLELLTKARGLAQQLTCRVEAILLGSGIDGLENELFSYGADVVHIGDDKVLSPYLTLPHTRLVKAVLEKEKPQIALFGATPAGRDLAPRIASALKVGLTADCTSLEIGDHYEKRSDTTYKNLLYQIRPAFGGNIVATIINPETKPQLATVREGVMKKERMAHSKRGEIRKINVGDLLTKEDLVVKIIERHIEDRKINIKNAGIIVAGGYGVGSKENFKLLFELADVLGGEVGGSRAAVDAGFIEHERQIGQTGITVRPKLYIACGISGQIQHRAGMTDSAMVISINTDSHAPINHVADYVINGEISDVLPKMIKYYKKNSK